MLIWVSLAALQEAPLQLRHVGLDADLCPLQLDHLRDRGEGHEADVGRELEAQPAFAIGAQAVPVPVLLAQPDLVQHGVRVLRVVGRPELAELAARVVGRLFGARDGARRAETEPERLVELIPVDSQGQRTAEVHVGEGLRSSSQVAVFLPCVVRHGEITGSSGSFPTTSFGQSMNCRGESHQS